MVCVNNCKSNIYIFDLLLRKIFPHRYRHIAAKCTRQNPDRRYADMEAVRKAMERSDRWRRWLPVLAMLVVMAPLVFLATRNQIPTGSTASVTDNALSEDEKKYVIEATWYLETVSAPLRSAAEKGDGYREVLLESLRKQSLAANDVLDEMSCRYYVDSEERNRFKNTVKQRQKDFNQEISLLISRHCKSFEEAYRLGHLSQREHDSLTWLLDAVVTTLPVDTVTAVAATCGSRKAIFNTELPLTHGVLPHTNGSS